METGGQCLGHLTAAEDQDSRTVAGTRRVPATLGGPSRHVVFECELVLGAIRDDWGALTQAPLKGAFALR